MKTNFISMGSKALYFLSYIMVLSSIFSAISFAQTHEEIAIQNAIKAGTVGYFSRDADAWKASWSHDAKATRTFVSNNSYSTTTGWEIFGPQMAKFFDENREPVDVEIVNQNFVIHQDGNLAYVEYDQVVTAPNTDPSINWVSREHRALILENGQWKIFSQTTINPESFSDSPIALERNLNATGYKLLGLKKTKDAIEVFRVSSQMNPQSSNAFYGLAEAYAQDGSSKLAIRHYEKSIQLNPQNENAKNALAKLK